MLRTDRIVLRNRVDAISCSPTLCSTAKITAINTAGMARGRRPRMSEQRRDGGLHGHRDDKRVRARQGARIAYCMRPSPMMAGTGRRCPACCPDSATARARPDPRAMDAPKISAARVAPTACGRRRQSGPGPARSASPGHSRRPPRRRRLGAACARGGNSVNTTLPLRDRGAREVRDHVSLRCRRGEPPARGTPACGPPSRGGAIRPLGSGSPRDDAFSGFPAAARHARRPPPVHAAGGWMPDRVACLAVRCAPWSLTLSRPPAPPSRRGPASACRPRAPTAPLARRPRPRHRSRRRRGCETSRSPRASAR